MIMEITAFQCEMCSNKARGEKQLRKENWLQIEGGTCQGVEVWLDKPRHKHGCYMHHVGWEKRSYHFCSVKCLIKALESDESI